MQDYYDIERMYWYWFTNLPYIGKVSQKKLLDYFITPKRVYQEFDESILKKLGITSKGIESLRKRMDYKEFKVKMYELKEKQIRFITIDDEIYPKRLKNIFQPPYCLYIRGKLPLEEKKTIAIVGSRSCSEYGRSMATFFANELAKEDVQVVSGLARGVDSYAHRGALYESGGTYAILGCGIDQCYPMENFNLYSEIVNAGGVISEYNIGYAPIAANFPMRNRIISGLSDGILLIEARRRSGSLITMDIGLEQGKEVYALPGRVMDELSYGTNHIIQQGGKLVMTPKDILEDLFGDSDRYSHHKSIELNLDTNESFVFGKLGCIPKHIGDLMNETKMNTEVLSPILIKLQIKGYIKQTAGNYYCRCVLNEVVD